MKNMLEVCGEISELFFKEANSYGVLYPWDTVSYMPSAILEYVQEHNCKEEFVQGMKDLLHFKHIRDNARYTELIRNNVTKKIEALKSNIRSIIDDTDGRTKIFKMTNEERAYYIESTTEEIEEWTKISKMTSEEYADYMESKITKTFNELDTVEGMTILDYSLINCILTISMLLDGADSEFVEASDANHIYESGFDELKEYLGI